MNDSRTTQSSAEALKRIRVQREAEERRFLALTLDCLHENVIVGDIHEYGGDRRPLLPLAIETAQTYPIPGMQFFGFAPFTEPRVVPGRAPKEESAFQGFVTRDALTVATGGKATLSAGPAAEILSLAERNRFMNSQNKVAFAIIHAPAAADAKAALEFVEPLLLEGSIVYFADLLAGYRRTPAKDAGRAFLEFQRNSRYRYLRHMDVGWWGRSYMACLDVDLPLERL